MDVAARYLRGKISLAWSWDLQPSEAKFLSHGPGSFGHPRQSFSRMAWAPNALRGKVSLARPKPADSGQLALEHKLILLSYEISDFSRGLICEKIDVTQSMFLACMTCWQQLVPEHSKTHLLSFAVCGCRLAFAVCRCLPLFGTI